MKRMTTPLSTVRGTASQDPPAEPARPHVCGADGLLAPLVLKFVTTTLEVELREHLGYDRHDAAGWGTGNSRNGVSPKIVTTDIGSLEIRVPRDRCGTFSPMLVPKRLRHLADLGATALLLYASGIPPRLVRDRIVALYHCAGSHPDDRLAGLVVAAALRDVHEWHVRPVPATEHLVLDKMRLSSPVGPIAVYLAVGEPVPGTCDVYGLWATPVAATAKPAPETLVAALRRIAEPPATVHVHAAADVVELAHRAWPKADVTTDAQRRLHNPFRERAPRRLPAGVTARTPMRRVSLVAG